MARKPLVRDFEAQIVDMTHDGRGVARLDGKAMFIAGALPGETVRAKQIGRSRSYDEAVTLEVLIAAPERVTPRCQHYSQCSGCVLQHFDEEKQIQAKQHVLIENLSRIGHVEPEEVFAPLLADRWGYRRKGRFSVRWVEKKDKTVVGFREDNPKFVADIQHCHTVIPAIGEHVGELATLIDTLEAKATIPQIEFIAGDAQIALVVRHLQPLSDSDTDKLLAFAKHSGFAIFLQPKGVDSVHALWPEQVDLYFDLTEHAVRLHFRPLDFIQVNARLNAQMINRAIAALKPNNNSRILDLFCGLGNFTLPLAKVSGEVVGVEGDAGLVARARDNAAINGIANAKFFAANLTEDQRGAPWMQQGFDALLLDPPRAGAAEVLAQLPLKSIDRIVYVSCHPASLARDAGFLVRERGYQLRGAGVMDMFPHTSHVESIAIFEKK